MRRAASSGRAWAVDVDDRTEAVDVDELDDVRDELLGDGGVALDGGLGRIVQHLDVLVGERH